MKNLVIAVAALALISCLQIQAQEPSFPSPQIEHNWLKQFAGEWDYSNKTVASGDQPEMQCSGSMNSHMLGGFWVINEMAGDMGGTTFNAIQTIGYDADKKKYVGTWVDSMMNHMWRYEGQVDDSGRKLILVAKGPNFMAEKKLTKFRDSYEFKTPDTIIATSEMMSEDGKWFTFMTGSITRKPVAKSVQ